MDTRGRRTADKIDKTLREEVGVPLEEDNDQDLPLDPL